MHIKRLKLVAFAVSVLVAGISGTVARGSTDSSNPPITTPNTACVLDTACNNANGCSWVSNQYDYWFPMGDCESGVNGASGNNCTSNYRACVDKVYYGIGLTCSGTVSDNVWTYQYGCGGTATN